MPPAVIALGAAGIGAAGSIIGGKMSGDAQGDAAAQQMDLARQAQANFQNIQAPSVEEQLLQLEQIKYSGNLTPEQEQAIAAKESELKAIQVNPDLRSAQMQSLKKLQDIGNQGGLDAVDRAQLNQIQNQVNNQNASNRASVLQSYAQRGMGGSGLEQAAQLMGSQAASGTAADQGFNVAAQAQQRALQAIQGAGQMGSSMEQQQFGEEAQKAQAQDAINRFNTQNQQDVQGRNVQRANYSQERNLNAQQQIGAQNTALANQQQIANKGLYQSDYNNQLQLAQARANALNRVASAAQAQGNANSNMYSAVGQGVGQLGTAVGSYFAGQPSASNTTQPPGTEYTAGNDFPTNKYKLEY